MRHAGCGPTGGCGMIRRGLSLRKMWMARKIHVHVLLLVGRIWTVEWLSGGERTRSGGRGRVGRGVMLRMRLSGGELYVGEDVRSLSSRWIALGQTGRG